MDTVLRGLKDVYGEVIIKRCQKNVSQAGATTCSHRKIFANGAFVR